LKGVGPFAVSRYKGASTLGGFDENEPVPANTAVREITASQSERMLRLHTVHTGGGASIQGNVHTGGGDFVGRDKVIHGDEVRGDKIQGDKVQGDKVQGDKVQGNKIHGDTYTVGNVQGPAAFGPGAQAKMDGGVAIGSLQGGIHDANIAGGDINHVNQQSEPATEEDPITKNPALQSLCSRLSTLYTTEADARRVAHDSNLDVTKIDFSTNAANRWHHLMVEAHKQDKVRAVVSNASFEYDSQAAQLKQAYQAYTKSIA